MKKILVRAASGSVYVALIVAALLLHTPYMFYGLLVLFTVLGIIELHHLVDNNDTTRRHKLLVAILDCFGGVSLFSTAFFFLVDNEITVAFFLGFFAYLVARIVAQIYITGENALQSFAHSCLTQAYVALPLTLLNVIYAFSPGLLLAIFIMIWLLFGDGIFGVFNDSPWRWVALGIVVPVFATWGDLAESLLKRTVHVKDSGHLIPGHGGILDRIDSLLLVSPAVVIFLFITALF